MIYPLRQELHVQLGSRPYILLLSVLFRYRNLPVRLIALKSRHREEQA
jgi:hypothetical protein